MDYTKLYNELVEEFDLKDLTDTDREEMLLEISKTIQKQFLLDIYDLLGKEKFEALQASIDMGEEFYTTTLKHLVPTYEGIFQAARTKVVKGFKKTG